MYKSIFILSDVRCGSTYSAELLSYNANKYLGMELWDLALEKFQNLTSNSSLTDVMEIFNGIWVNPHGWRCAMIKCAHMSIINKLVDNDPEVARVFFGPSAYWILIRRDDVFARAVSLAHALASDRFHEYSDGKEQNYEYTISNEKIYSCLEMITLADAFLCGCASRFTNLREFHYKDIMNNERDF